MTRAGKYLYCIIRSGEERAFANAAPIGGESGSVYSVPHQGLAVVVSDVESEEQYDVTRSHMLAHQRVQERVMEELTVLPVRFGTVAKGMKGISPVDDIQRLLVKRSEEFEQLLGEMEGKVELGLKALWRDEAAIYQEILAENAAIRRLRDTLVGKPPEVARFQGIPLGEMVKKALEQKKEREAAGLLASLRPLASRTQESAILLDRMVVNAAFLVEKQRDEEFGQAVGRLDREHGQRVAFRYVGPVPPYNFVNLVVNWEDL
jgi:hypothetical protein